MCCGYYDRIKNAEITPERFYTKRIAKLLPFFALLVLLDIIGTGGKDSLWEASADITMVFNLLPDLNIEVIGVGWALGVIFLFYFLFPFFVYTISTKRRAWLTFAVSIALSLSCVFYSMTAASSIRRCSSSPEDSCSSIRTASVQWERSGESSRW